MSREFGNRLASKMKEQRMSVRDASSKCGVAVSTIQNWRNGASPKEFVALQNLAECLGTTLSYLLTGKDERSNATVGDVFENGEMVFDGLAKITIQRLVSKHKEDK